jgi:DNA recombination protein RmuC
VRFFYHTLSELGVPMDGSLHAIDWLPILISLLSGLAAFLSALAFVRAGRRNASIVLALEQISQLLRTECDRLRQSNEDQARSLRQELTDNLRGFQDFTLRTFRDLSDSLANQIKEFSVRLDVDFREMDQRFSVIQNKLDADISRMSQEANVQRDQLRQVMEAKLDGAASKQAVDARTSREEIIGSFRQLGAGVAETLDRAGAQQKGGLDNVTKSLDSLVEKHERTQESLRQTVEARLDVIRTANEQKLDEMRKTVNEKLQSTLDERLGQNFQLVSEQLQKVSIGLGQMQQLAAGVGDLTRVLTQVKPRGIWGETQLGSLLEDFLAPDQFARNVQVKPDSQERVEFAIRLPRLTGGHDEVLLPIDAKFPHESFERVVAAAEAGNAVELEDAGRALERSVRTQAKDIASKYISPPQTTDYAVMFLPSESLYAEVARRPGLVEALSREHAIMMAGPSTLTALLNAIRVGFRSALIHRQAGEVSKLLQKVRSEFEKYGEAVSTAYKRAERTVEAIGKLQTRQNVMGKALKGIDLLSADTPVDAANMFLELETKELEVSTSAEA